MKGRDCWHRNVLILEHNDMRVTQNALGLSRPNQPVYMRYSVRSICTITEGQNLRQKILGDWLILNANSSHAVQPLQCDKLFRNVVYLSSLLIIAYLAETFAAANVWCPAATGFLLLNVDSSTLDLSLHTTNTWHDLGFRFGSHRYFLESATPHFYPNCRPYISRVQC